MNKLTTIESQDIDEYDNWKVGQANELIKARYSMTYLEKCVLTLALSKIDYRNDCPDRITFTVGDFINVFGSNKKSAYRELRLAIDRLSERWLTIRYERDGKIFDGATRWMYRKGICEDGTIEIAFSPDVMPMLGNLKTQYTKVKLMDLSKLKTFHAFRFFEILISGLNASKRDMYEFAMTVDAFRESMDVKDKYPRWPDLRRYIIDKAIDDIQANTGYSIEVSTKKKGRSINKIIFSIMWLGNERN